MSFTKPDVHLLIAMFLKISVLSSAFVSLCISAGADVKFRDVADVSGIEFQHFTGATGARYMPETMGAGCAFLDYDADGNLDILLANGTSLTLPNAAHTPRLYRNTGDGQWLNAVIAEVYMWDRVIENDEMNLAMKTIGGLAVQPGGKLTTTWGNVKKRH